MFVSLSILLISIISLGITMLFFVANHWENEKKDSLIENATQVSAVFNKLYHWDPHNQSLVTNNEDLFDTTIELIAESVDAEIFVFYPKGQLIACSQQHNCGNHGDSISPLILSRTVRDDFFELGTLDDFFDDTYYTAGVPVTTHINNEEVIVAFCFVSTESNFVSMLTMSMMKLFLIAAFITLIIAFVFVGIFSYRLAKPLRQMSIAAKKFATGDFSARINVTSDDEIGQLATALNEMADSLSSSEGMRRSFIANVSHELKTPMTTISGFVDGILDGTIPPQNQRHYLNIVSLEVKRLSRLVQSMLSLSRIDNGELKLNRQEFEMVSVIINVLAGFEPRIREKNIEIRGLENFRKLKVNADPDLMHQVIYNLIENAVKFTNENGYIKFDVVQTKYEISVSIENSGPGIPPEDIRYIFDRFYKTDKSRSVDKKGMGLGLFITKSIMRLHGGHIYVESVPDTFCRFTFNLPLFISHKEQKPNKYINTTATNKPED